MELFSPRNNTISDKQMAELKRKARNDDTESMFSGRSIARKAKRDKQYDKAKWS